MPPCACYFYFSQICPKNFRNLSQHFYRNKQDNRLFVSFLEVHELDQMKLCSVIPGEEVHTRFARPYEILKT